MRAVLPRSSIGAAHCRVSRSALPLLPQWMSWNVTQTVKDWLAGQANYGFLVKRNPDTLGVGGILVEDSSSPSFAPKIDVTYNQAVSLDAPVTVHSNGAELTWSRWDTTLGAFTSYEVHRSTSASFTPSSSTLLATIRDVSVTNYRDTTAAPNGSFTYKVVMGTNVSNGQIVALPAAGLAQKTLQPGPGALAAGFLEKIEGYSSCANAGSNDTLRVGANATDTYRSLLAFQLGDIPPGSAINSATLSLYLKTAPSTATNIAVHRLTSGWDEGTGWWHCVGTGATWWDERSGAELWRAAQGRDRAAYRRHDRDLCL